jgi:hypothetical protein
MRLGAVLVLALALTNRGIEAAYHGNWCGLRHGEKPEDLIGCSKISEHETGDAKRILDVLPGHLPLPLEQLDLASSTVGAAGAAQIGALLSAKTTHVRDLDLSGCGLGDAGVATLVDAIVAALAAGNTTKLEGLDVSRNGITSEGAVSLAKLIKAE